MLKVRNTQTGVVVAGNRGLLKRSIDVDFLEVVDSAGNVLSNEAVKYAVDNFHNRQAYEPAPKREPEPEPEPEEDTEILENTSEVAAAIGAAQSKDELEVLVRENFGIDLDKRRNFSTLKKQALDLADSME